MLPLSMSKSAPCNHNISAGCSIVLSSSKYPTILVDIHDCKCCEGIRATNTSLAVSWLAFIHLAKALKALSCVGAPFIIVPAYPAS